jgi:heme/copper-type cytochrome/quinol oxidase subunit 1
LKSALCSNEPSTPHDKLQNDDATSYDPIVDHLMSSHAFRVVIWFLFVTLVAIGLTIVSVTIAARDVAYRSVVLQFGGYPIALICPFMAMVVLPFSRRLR